MKIIRWLLSHSFLILLIVAVIYGYMFWGNLLGKDTPAGKAVAYLSSEFVVVEDFVNAVKAKQAGLNAEQPSDESIGQSAELQASVSGDEGKVSQITEQSIEEPAAAEVAVTEVSNEYATLQTDERAGNRGFTQTQMQQGAADVTGSEAKPQPMPENMPKQENVFASSYGLGNSTTADTQPATDGTPTTGGAVQRNAEQAFVSPEIEKQLENVDKQGRVIDESKEENTVKEDWITARKSFYQRNYELSEQSYQKVIENTEDNFDAYGELGNVYFNQGKNEQAASAYYEAAAILVRKGQVGRARSLIGLLRHLDKSKATELQQLIDSAVS